MSDNNITTEVENTAAQPPKAPQPQNMKNKVFSGLFWKFGERICAQAVSFVIGVILARLLMPRAYGIVALVASFINIADVFVTGGFSSSLIQKKDADDVDFSSVMYFSIIFSIVLYAGLFIAAPFLAKAYNMPELSPVLRVFSLRLPIAAFNSVQHAYVSRHMLFKRFFWSTLGGTLGSAVVGITMAYCGFGVWALVGQYMFNSIVDTIVLWFTVKWRPVMAFSFKRLKDLLSYGWKILASSLLNTGYNELQYMAIGLKYNPESLSFYNKGNQFPQLVVNNVNTSISSVLFPALSQYQDDKAKVKELTRRAIRVSSYLIWPCMFGLMAVADGFISILLTDKWLPCVPYLRILCISYGLWPVHTANLEALKAIGRSDLFLVLEVIKKIIGFSLLFAALLMGNVYYIAIAVLISGLLSCIVNAFPNTKLLKYSYFEQFKDLFPSLAMSAIMFAAVYVTGFIPMNKYLLFCLQITVGGAVYLTLSIITRNKEFRYIFDYAKGLLSKFKK